MRLETYVESELQRALDIMLEESRKLVKGFK